jgi:hypothetical protein
MRQPLWIGQHEHDLVLRITVPQNGLDEPVKRRHAQDNRDSHVLPLKSERVVSGSMRLLSRSLSPSGQPRSEARRVRQEAFAMALEKR